MANVDIAEGARGAASHKLRAQVYAPTVRGVSASHADLWIPGADRETSADPNTWSSEIAVRVTEAQSAHSDRRPLRTPALLVR